MTCFAVIGAGTIGAVHARNVAAHPGFTLASMDAGRAVSLERVW